MSDNPFSDPSVKDVNASEPDWLESTTDMDSMKSRWEGSSASAAPAESAYSFPDGPMETMEPLNPSGDGPGDYDHLPPAETGGSSAKGGDKPLDKIQAAITDITTAPLPKLVTYMRVANFLAAGLMIASSVLTILADSSASFSTLIICLYVSCFGCLLCCFETHLKSVAGVIADNFGFMYSARGRFVFLTLLSTLCFGMDLIGKLTGVLLCLTACLNLYVIIKFPEYEKDTLLMDQQGEGPDSLKAMALGWGTNALKSNPQAVAAAATAAGTWALENPEVANELRGAAATAAVQAVV